MAFSTNFQKLKQKKIIPSDINETDIDKKHPVWAIIDGLDDDKIKIFEDIARDTNSHIFLHERDKKGKIVAMGL
jgi:hypothetical protein